MGLATQRRQKIRWVWIGRDFHARIDSFEALPQVLALDPALWGAVSAPKESFYLDPIFLDWVDQDRDGRIHIQEIRQAIVWFLEHVDPVRLRSSEESAVPIAAFRSSSPLRVLAETVSGISSSDPDTKTVGLEEVRDIQRAIAAGRLRTVRALRPEAIPNKQLQKIVEEAVRLGYGQSGGALALEGFRKFLDIVQRVQSWKQEEERLTGQLGGSADSLSALAQAYRQVREALDFWFLASEALTAGIEVEKEAKVVPVGLSVSEFQDRLAAQPIVPLQASQELRLQTNWNPVYAEAMELLCRTIWKGQETLNRADWEQWKRILEELVKWWEAAPRPELRILSADQLQQWVQDRESLIDAFERYVNQSSEQAFDPNQLRELELVLLCHRQLLRLLNCFVGFCDLYDPSRKSAVEVGTLVLDGRLLEFCVRVQDRKRHAAFCTAGNLFVVYAQVIGADGKPRFEVAAPLTRGLRGTLQVGKWGLFRDRTGRIFHAQIVQIVENPISLMESILVPFRRAGRAITGKLESWAKETEGKVEKAVGSAVTVPTSTKPKTAGGAPVAWGGLGGMVAGGGVALAAVGGAVAYATKALSEVHWISVVGMLVGLILFVTLPFVIVGAVRLSRRDLAMLLEGAGWGINKRMRLTGKVSRRFTRRPRGPGSLDWGWGIVFLMGIILIIFAILYGLSLLKGLKK